MILEECTKAPTIWDAMPGDALNNWTCNPSPVLRESCKQTNKSVNAKNVTCNETSAQNPNSEQTFAEYEEDMQPGELTKEFEQFENKEKPNLDETETINLGDSAELVRETRISVHLTPSQRKDLIDLLRQYIDVFAWSYDDMPGLSTDIVSHRLPIDPSCPPVKQKPRKIKLDLSLKVKEEVSKFILVAIDYFTKWVEASSYKSVTKKVVTDFVRNNIICRFGIPESIITDNGANLNSGLMHEICEKFKIIHRNSTPYRPQMNGAVEAANKNIKRILRKMIDNYKHWHESLSFALLGYRTTIRTSTGATPYLLVYGTEAVLPMEVEIPSLRIIQEAELSDAKWTQSRYEQLMLIDEKRMNAVCHGQLYQHRMVKAFNKKVRLRQFEPGQLVLKRIFPHQDEAKGKFAPNWQGPYMVHRVLTGGALILAEMDGKIWPKAINADAVKRYYI
ncbi:uncharacterized protein LOC125850203 [Solanum stenotomum]|uniref:uncharacterized protein LOC125850203 n=1 Tax=Solanum stenotomum TaxID=172797 RepID=UPI0020D164A9|nr:uncharacterized protein LOC125850203 [Solanum stenotomum]